MSRQNIRIEQIENVAEFCRMDQSGATPPVGPFLPYDAEAWRVDLDGIEDDIPLWSNLLDTFYFGKVIPWSVAGFRVGTIVPDHAGLTIEYWDSVIMGGSWQPLTFRHDSTALFSQDGYITWIVPGDWGLQLVDGVSAFWIRVRSTGVNVQGRASHFMPTIIGKPPLIVYPKFEPKEKRITRDVNSTLHRKDAVQKFVKQCIVDCTQLAFTMADLNYLRYLIEFRHKCRLTDLAATVPISFSQDAFYRWYEGFIVGQLDKTASPFKMKPEQYVLMMDVDNAQSIFTALGVSPS